MRPPQSSRERLGAAALTGYVMSQQRWQVRVLHNSDKTRALLQHGRAIRRVRVGGVGALRSQKTPRSLPGTAVVQDIDVVEM
jgi:hypothetical protein